MESAAVSLGLSASQLDLLAGTPDATRNLSARGQELPRLGGRSTSRTGSDLPGGELEEKFEEFVGTVFFAQFMKAMRRTAGKPAYFHGGQAEEIFQGQLDQTLIEQLAKQQGGSLGAELFERFRQGLTGESAAGPENSADEARADGGLAFLARL